MKKIINKAGVIYGGIAAYTLSVYTENATYTSIPMTKRDIIELKEDIFFKSQVKRLVGRGILLAE